MKKTLLFALLFAQIACQSTHFSTKEKTAAATEIRRTMAAQEAAWNRGELEKYMVGYWESDSLRFIGSKGLTHGWQPTLANYQKGYPDRAAMGTLHFDLIDVEVLSPGAAFVIGKWALARPEKGDISGHFTLLWKKTGGRWVIVADHSS